MLSVDPRDSALPPLSRAGAPAARIAAAKAAGAGAGAELSLVDGVAGLTGAWIDFRFIAVGTALAHSFAPVELAGRLGSETLGPALADCLAVLGRVASTGLPEALDALTTPDGRRRTLVATPVGRAPDGLLALVGPIYREDDPGRCLAAGSADTGAGLADTAAGTQAHADTQAHAERQAHADTQASADTEAAADTQAYPDTAALTLAARSPIAQGLVGDDGRIRYVNAAAVDAIGAPRDAILGEPLWALDWFANDASTALRLRAAVERAATLGTSEALTFVLDRDGRARSFDFSLQPVADSPSELVFVAIETTARFRAEQALVQARKLEAIGRLTGGIAHDFNNLLMAVLGSLELLRKRCVGQTESLKLIANATRAVDRGTSLTRRMLAFARRQDLKTEAVRLGELVHDMQDLIQRSIGPMITVETRCASALPPVRTDLNQLEAALLNLVINARDAVDGQGRILISGEQVRVTSHEALRPGLYVTLAVSDDGSGMTAATLGQALEPFFTTKGVGKGTGLGLPMVLGLAEQCGGTLTLDSAPGLGTTATIWLPAMTDDPGFQARSDMTGGATGDRTDDATDDRTGDTAGAPPFMAPSAANLRRLRILAVDDDDLILTGTVAMLEDLGHHVATATSGGHALDLLERHEFDLLLTDHAMPGMSGLQLADLVRARDPDLPIVLMTGFADLPIDEVRVAGRELPRLAKPFWQADLEAAVTAASRRRPDPIERGSRGLFLRRSR